MTLIKSLTQEPLFTEMLHSKEGEILFFVDSALPLSDRIEAFLDNHFCRGTDSIHLYLVDVMGKEYPLAYDHGADSESTVTFEQAIAQTEKTNTTPYYFVIAKQTYVDASGHSDGGLQPQEYYIFDPEE